MKTPRKKLEKKADALFRDIVKSDGICEKCGSREFLQCAHVVSRSYKQVRWDFNNAYCLCRKCHVSFTHHPLEWEDWVVEQMGRSSYQMLKDKARQYGKIDYEMIINRLNND